MSVRPRLRLPLVSRLPISTRRHASVLFALSALSNSRETQHFNRITHLPRSEHSPPLKLIQTGEVDPFPLPDKPTVHPVVVTPWPSRTSSTGAQVGRVWDQRALAVGRTILNNQARQTHRLQRALTHVKRRQLRKDTIALHDKLSWEQERAKLRNELRVAGVWILGSIATATGLAMWRFWPDGSRADLDLGRRIAASAALDAAAVRVSEAAQPVMADVKSVDAIPAASVGGGSSEVVAADAERSWWKGLFWKQQ